MGTTWLEIIINTVKIAAIFVIVVSTVPLLVWVERRGPAFMQNRLGPNRVGPLGLLQLAADAIKFIFKEEFIPTKAEKILYFMAPGLTLLPAALTFAAIPLSTPINILGYTFKLQIADLNIGLIYIFAVASLGVYGILAAGWSSGNKYAMLGALRASSQMISYEIAMGLSVVGVLMMYQTFSLNQMITEQFGYFSFLWQGSAVELKFLPNWGVFFQPLAFILFLTATFAETNRLPFDLPEGEAELVAGFHTEYGGFKFNMFFMGEYGHMITSAALITTLFFGGYALPFISPEQVREFWIQNGHTLLGFTGLSMPDIASVLTTITHLVVFLAKTGFWLFFFIWVRWTLPRFRYDQLMDLGWKTLLPWSLVNLALTTALMYFARIVK
ncbi:MAG: NADH-quinone oxidoreductase subunit NuoH [Oligoflexia bacterium]|nr:NADH-quinone oxidoreductase subunit NuoH [Oligoflexia bacterium]